MSTKNDEINEWMEAVKNNSKEKVETFIKNGIDVNIYDGHGLSALYCASNEGHAEIVQLLISSGAKLKITFAYRTGYSRSAILSTAIQKKHIGIIRLLIHAGADVNKRLRGLHRSFLHRAIRDNDMDMANILLDVGANINILDAYKRTPLCYAARVGKTNGLRFLLRAGADVNYTCYKGRTALHFAAMNPIPENVELLLSFGANIYAEDDFMKKPEDMGTRYGRRNYKRVLEDVMNETKVHA